MLPAGKPLGFWQRILLAERAPALRYGAAVLVACGSLLLVQLLNLIEQDAQLQALATLGVVISAIYGGMGPGLLAALISAIGVDYLFIEPLEDVLASWASVLRVLTYGIIAMIIASIVGALRNAYRELHGLYREAEAARHARESMLAIVSHDLRSPLSAVLLGIAYVKRALSQGKPAQSLAGAFDAIHHSADSMKRLVDDLLDAARIEAGRFSVQPSRQPLLPILEDAVEAARLPAEARRIRLEFEPPTGEHFVRCDRQRLTQVLANLLGNALKFSAEGAAVRLTLREDAEWLRIEVRDHGPGISEDDLPRVFDRHWQAAGQAHMGAGLGLFIARAIVESHGGHISVESRPGEGCTFRVALRREGSDPAS